MQAATLLQDDAWAPSGIRPLADGEAALVPDLLHPVPLVRIDVAHARASLALAFASGVSGGLFTELLDRASVAPSTWEPEAFASELFLPRFVATCLRARVGGVEPVLARAHLVRLLAHPPTDAAVADHRRGVLAELVARPELRTALEDAYVELCRFRALVEGATGTGKYDPNRRKLDILASTKAILDGLTRFAHARSGLVRLADYAARVQADEPYRSLADLLRYEQEMATVDLQVAVGADGRIRSFRLVAAREDATNTFAMSPWRRWLTKLELFVRGYRFGDGEVMAHLVDAVYDGLEGELVHFVQLLGDIEFYLGALGFKDLAGERGLEVCLPAIGHERRLEGLFNPLLLAQPGAVVPCAVVTDRPDVTTLVTGPNSGGKTRLLQAIGLTQILAQSGMFVPARAACVTPASGLVVSLSQESRADAPEGRLGMELMRIRALFEVLPPGAMVLLDELCSGTNPSEGEEIFELVVRMLERLGPQAFITTHFLAFAARLANERRIDGLRFLQVELGASQQATYQFVPGVAATSLAGHAAERLGVTAEQLLAVIERKVTQSGR